MIVSFGPAPLLGLVGDDNADGTVDAGDSTVWRDNLNSHTPFFNETASPGVVDVADYDAWKRNFGATTGLGTGACAPEPGSGLLLLVGLFCFAAHRCRA